MKLWLTTTENKCFVKMLWHLLGEYVKTTVLCSICTVHRFFYFFILFFSQSSICALFSIEFLHCSYSVFHCSSTIPFWLATLSFSFSLLFVLFVPFYIYIYIYHYTSSVFAPCAHYSCNSALVSWIFFFFFPLCSTLLFIQLAL